MYLFSNSSNENAVTEARKIHAVALKEAPLVPDVYVSTVEFEIEHGNNVKATFFACMICCISVLSDLVCLSVQGM